MGSLDDIFSRKRQKVMPSSSARLLNFERHEQMAYERAKKRIVKREATREGTRRAEDELLSEQRKIEAKKKKKKMRIERLKKAGKGTVRRIASIQAPRVSRRARSGIFRRSSFGR